MTTLHALLFVLAAAPAESPVDRFMQQIIEVAGPETQVIRETNGVQLRREVVTRPMNAANATDVERHTFVLTLTLSPFVDEKSQQKRLAAAFARERASWKSVSRLECDGMEFTDRYVDGLCFRTKTEAQAQRVAAYRRDRDQWLAVPRFHVAQAFTVALRGARPELTEGCSSCDDLERKVTALLTPYP